MRPQGWAREWLLGWFGVAVWSMLAVSMIILLVAYSSPRGPVTYGPWTPPRIPVIYAHQDALWFIVLALGVLAVAAVIQYVRVSQPIIRPR